LPPVSLIPFYIQYVVIEAAAWHALCSRRGKAKQGERRITMKVLVVDDNRFLADTIQEILEEGGVEVRYAKDGLDGYWAYLSFHPDVIITDIQMPRKNGLEMMRRIRVHNPAIRTVYMSGNMDSFQSFLAEEKKQYPVSYVEKPFSMESLLREVTH
jgi:two-component system OmpR family response regulator